MSGLNYAKEGWRYDNKVTATMVEDMLFDPILAAKVLLDIQIPPHQELRLLHQWCTFLTIDDSGFSTGKTFTNAILMALRSVLIPNHISGVLAGTFRQGRLMFQYIERWSHTSKIFRSCLRQHRGGPHLVHQNDIWQAFYRGGSENRVLPPNFAQDSERLRSERWHCGYFDEWTKFGSLSAITKTLFGRVTALNTYGDCPVRGNHIHLSSTPGFMHEPCYSLIDDIDKRIERGNPDYARFTCNYRHVPKTPKWRSFVDRRTIYLMQTTNPKGIVASEIDGIWQKDSQSFYESFLLEEARVSENNYAFLVERLHEQDIYVLAYDTARGNNDNQRAEGDDFAAAVYRIPGGITEQAYCCCLVRKNNITAANMAGIIHDLHARFHLAMIVYDPGGGGLFVRDELMKLEQVIKGKVTTVQPILDWIDTSGLMGYNLGVPFRRKHFAIQQLWGTMASDSVLINQAHEKFRGAVEQLRLRLPPEWKKWNDLDINLNIDDMRNYLGKMTGATELDRIKAELDLAVRQLIYIDVVRDKEGKPITDSFGMFKFKSKKKKDSAYAMIYGYVAVLAYDQLVKKGNAGVNRGGSSFACSTQTY